MQKPWWAKTLRVVAIVLMGLTATFTLMGGIGTSCVALNPTSYGESFAGIAPYQWLYILFVLVTVAIGVSGVRAVVLLIKGKRGAYRSALVVLIAGLIVGMIHIAVSRILRGGSMPVDMVVYITILTLIVFLLFKLPGLSQELIFEKPNGEDPVGKNAAAIMLISNGLLTLTIQFLMAPTHTINGINYADVWHVVFSLLGGGLVLTGILTALSRPREILICPADY